MYIKNVKSIKNATFYMITYNFLSIYRDAYGGNTLVP